MSRRIRSGASWFSGTKCYHAENEMKNHPCSINHFYSINRYVPLSIQSIHNTLLYLFNQYTIHSSIYSIDTYPSVNTLLLQYRTFSNKFILAESSQRNGVPALPSGPRRPSDGIVVFDTLPKSTTLPAS